MHITAVMGLEIFVLLCGVQIKAAVYSI